MKTPREILLARHQAAEPKLDEIRSAIVADLTRPQSGEPRFSFLLQLWCELIWPCRRTWAGLAAIWLAIGLMNLSQSERDQIASSKSSPPPGEMRLALQEQRRVLAEIIGANVASSPAEPPRRPNIQPRSGLHPVAMA